MNLKPDERFTLITQRLAEIEKEFPDFYIGLWCPADFTEALNNIGRTAPANDEALYEFSCTMVERLHDNHDASTGINWEVLNWTAHDIDNENNNGN